MNQTRKNGDVPTLALDMVPFFVSSYRNRIAECTNSISTVLSMISSVPGRVRARGSDEDCRHSDYMLPSNVRLDERFRFLHAGIRHVPGW
jgi:hypothetical protein